MKFVLLLLIGMSTVLANPLITGVMYNPLGPDSGSEWVEIYGNYQGPCSLWFGNGANQDDWSMIWEDDIILDGFKTIGEGNVDIPVPVSLQNGPDALMLECNNRDIVGWGSHEFSEYYEGRPASSIKEGFVLSRLFQEVGEQTYPVDTNDNSKDFQGVNRTFRGGSSSVDVMIYVGNIAPLILSVSCNDDMVQDGIQILPRWPSTTLNCSVDVYDQDLAYVKVYGLGREQSFNDSVAFSILPTDSAGIHTILFEAVDSHNATDVYELDIEILPSKGLSISPQVLVWDKHSEPKQITLTNTGNTPINISINNTVPVRFTVEDQGNFTLDHHITLDGLDIGEQRSIFVSPRLATVRQTQVTGRLLFVVP